MRLLLPSIFLLALVGCGESYTGEAPSDADVNSTPVSMGDGDDNDGDGYGERVDCDDDDASVNPSAQEICADEIDNDCDDLVDGDDGSASRDDFCYDGDGDGLCQDYDGDGVVDIVHLCEPSDAETIVGQTGGDTSLVNNYIEAEDSGPPLYSYPDVDCDDTNDEVYPGAPEICDDVDNDCDEATGIDEDAAGTTAFYTDGDGDGYGDELGSATWSCDAPEGTVGNNLDCDDAVTAVSPDATEVCDELDTDEDCDGDADDADDSVSLMGVTEWFSDGDTDGYGGTSEGWSCDGDVG